MTVVTPSLCVRVCSLTIDHTQVKENATYAVLFGGSGDSASFGIRLPNELFTLCQSNGGDICFATNSDGTGRLNVELVSIDTANKKAEIWVSILLSTSADKTIYVFYQSTSGTLSQPAASASYGSQAVWTAVGNLLSVHHLEESSNPYVDSTSNGHNSTAGTYPTRTIGKIGHGQTFNSTVPNYITLGNYANNLSEMTVSLWAAYAYNTNFINCLISKQLNNSSAGWEIGQTTNWATEGQLICEIRQDTTYVTQFHSVNTWSDGNYHLIQWVFTGTALANQTLYVDGIAQSLTISIPPDSDGGSGLNFSNSEPVILGSQGEAYFTDGGLDEIRIANIARSGNYLSTEYVIQHSTNLVTVGTPTNNNLNVTTGIFKKSNKSYKLSQRSSKFILDPNHPYSEGLSLAFLGSDFGSLTIVDSCLFRRHGSFLSISNPSTSKSGWGWDTLLRRPYFILDGVDDKISFKSLPQVKACTTACWVKINLTGSSYMPMLTSLSAAHDAAFYLFGDTGRITVVDDGNTWTQSVNLTWSANLWYHVVCVCRSTQKSGTIEFFRNGTSLGTSVFGSSYGITTSYLDGVGIWGGNDKFMGNITDVMFWDYAVPSQMIAKLANPANINYDGLILPRKRKSFSVANRYFINFSKDSIFNFSTTTNSIVPSVTTSVSTTVKKSNKRYKSIQRPTNFRLNLNHLLSRDLVFAGLGNNPGGLKFLDSSIFSNHGKLVNMNFPPTSNSGWGWNAYLQRMALNFDGTDDYVKGSNIVSARATLTFGAWICTGNVNDGNRAIVCFGSVAGTSKTLTLKNLNKSLSVDVSGITVVAYVFSGMANNTWYRLDCTYSATGDLVLYLNGKAVTSGNCGALITSDDWEIGTSYQSAAYFLWSGSISDVTIHKRLLSPTEISILANPADPMLGGLILPPRRKSFPVTVASISSQNLVLDYAFVLTSTTTTMTVDNLLNYSNIISSDFVNTNTIDYGSNLPSILTNSIVVDYSNLYNQYLTQNSIIQYSDLIQTTLLTSQVVDYSLSIMTTMTSNFVDDIALLKNTELQYNNVLNYSFIETNFVSSAQTTDYSNIISAVEIQNWVLDYSDQQTTSQTTSSILNYSLILFQGYTTYLSDQILDLSYIISSIYQSSTISSTLDYSNLKIVSLTKDNIVDYSDYLGISLNTTSTLNYSLVSPLNFTQDKVMDISFITSKLCQSSNVLNYNLILSEYITKDNTGNISLFQQTNLIKDGILDIIYLTQSSVLYSNTVDYSQTTSKNITNDFPVNYFMDYVVTLMVMTNFDLDYSMEFTLLSHMNCEMWTFSSESWIWTIDNVEENKWTFSSSPYIWR
jgi:hypothetical protein